MYNLVDRTFFLALLLPFTCAEWSDSIVYCKLERPSPGCGASPDERTWCEPSEEGETSHVSMFLRCYNIVSFPGLHLIMHNIKSDFFNYHSLATNFS